MQKESLLFIQAYWGCLQSIFYLYTSTPLFLLKHRYWNLHHLDKILDEFYISITISQVEAQVFWMSSFDLSLKPFSNFHRSVIVWTNKMQVDA